MYKKTACQSLEKGNKIRNRVSFSQKPVEVLLIIPILLSLAICLPKTGLAFDGWTGKVTTNVNLRKAPGLDGEIITRLKKGDMVVVEGQHGEWKKIVLEKEAYGYKGWVYAKYLERIPAEETEPEASLHEAMTETILEQGIIETPLQGLVPENIPQGEEAGSDIIITSADDSSPAEVHPLVVEAASNEATPSRMSVPVLREMTNNDSIVVAKDMAQHSARYHGIAVFLKMLLSFSTVALSCVAVLLSCRAIQVAKSGSGDL